MAVITTGNYPKLLWPGLNKIFGMEYAQYPQEWAQCFDTSISKKDYEEDAALSGFGLAPVKTEGNSLYFDTSRQNYITRYTNVSYALGFIITREEIDDNQYAEVAPMRTRCLAYSHHQTKENVAANIFNRAFNGAYVGGDNVSLCNASHPIEGGTFANVPVDSGGALQGVDLAEATLEQAIIDIKQNFRDNRNLRIDLRPQKLLVPVNLQFEAVRILKNPERPATADRDINAMYQMGIMPQGYTVNHYLTDSDAWFVLTDCPVGLRYFDRSPLRFENDNEFDTKNMKYSAYERYVFGWSDPRAIWGSPGA